MRSIIVTTSIALCWGCTATVATTEPDAGATPSEAQPATGNPTAEQPTTVQTDAPTIECRRDNEIFGPVLLDEEGLALRHGHGVSRFSELESSHERPAEVCGVRESLALLMAMRCDDGSGPFENASEAHGSRGGNMGPGGRCGSMIDLYSVPCPEGTHEVYIDMYMCSAEGNAFLE